MENREYRCDICGKVLHSAKGLSGHKQIVHGDRAKPGVSADHVLAEALESAIDSQGVLMEALAAHAGILGAASAKMDDLLRSEGASGGHTPPSMALIEVWEACPDCSPKWRELKPELLDRLAAELESAENPGATEGPRRWLGMRRYPSSGFKWSAEHERYCFITDDELVVKEWRGRKDIKVVELEPALET